MSFRFKYLAFSVALACSSPLTLAYEEGEEDAFEEDLEDFYGDEEFVSIATGTKKAVSKAPSVATVITREDILRMGATNLDEVLERVPGLHAGFSNLSRLDSSYSVRGIQTGFNPQILVLLNGVEFKVHYSGGMPYTFRYPLNSIERVEVIRGPGSALYGADAFSGVINIITRNPEESNIEVGGRVGSFSSKDLWAGYEDTFADGFWNIYIDKSQSDGDDERIATADLQSALDAAFGTSASNAPSSLSTRYDITNLQMNVNWNNWRFQYWRWEQSDGGQGPGGAQALDPNGYQDFVLNRAILTYQKELSDSVGLKVRASKLNTDVTSFFNLFPNGTVLPIGPDGNVNFVNVAGVVSFPDGFIGVPSSQEDDTSIEASFIWSPNSSHKITSAFGYKDLSIDAQELKNFGPGIIDGTQPVVDGTLTDVTGTPFTYIPNVSRDVKYFLIQDEWQLANDWEATIGVRHDDFSDFGSVTNPRIALVWQAAHNLTVKTLYGSAFRAPSFNEMFLINNPAAVGNPDVEPEEIDTFELALEYRPNFDTRIAFNLYSYEAKKLIDKVQTAEGLVTENVRDQDGYGFETEIDYKISENAEIHFNYSNQSSEDTNSNLDVADVPGQLAYFDLFYSFNDSWELSSQLWWVADRKRIVGDLREEMDDDVITSLKLNWKAREKTNISFLVKNVFDSEASEPSDGRILNDYQREGRSIWIELQQEF